MTAFARPGAREVIQRANQIKLRRRRFFPGGVAFPTRPYNRRQLQQAVNLIRRRGDAKDRKVLEAAGFRSRSAR